MMEGESAETEPLIQSSSAADRPDPAAEAAARFTVYRRRWFILSVLCLLNCSNAMAWLTFAPVAGQSAQLLCVSLPLVNWLSLVFVLAAVVCSFSSMWVLDTLGLRCSLIGSSWLNACGCVLRVCGVLSVTPQWAVFAVVMCGQTLCALAQPLVIFAPTKLAALWFPDHQRATANMLASMANTVGLLLANLLSPLIVSYSGDLFLLLLIYSIPAAVACLLATLGIHQAVPPTPASASSSSSASEPFLQGIRQLLRNRAYWILLLCFGSGIGIFTCFSTLLEQILCVKGYSNGFAGVCGAVSIVCGVAGAFLLSLYVDRSKKFMEVMKICMCLTSVSCSAFAVVSQLPAQSVLLVLVCCCFGLFGYSVYPVGMELSVETTHPLGEATSAGLIFTSGQIQAALYLLLLQALATPTHSPTSVCAADTSLNWTVPVLVMAGVCAVSSCGFVVFFHTEYRRLRAEADSATEPEPTGDAADA